MFLALVCEPLSRDVRMGVGITEVERGLSVD